MGFFFFLLRLHSFFPSLHIGTKENGGGKGDIAMLWEGIACMSVYWGRGKYSAECVILLDILPPIRAIPITQTQTDTASLLLLLFWTVPWGGISLWITYYPWKEKNRFLLESSKEEEEEDPSPFRIRVCVPPLLVWNLTNLWLQWPTFVLLILEIVKKIISSPTSAYTYIFIFCGESAAWPFSPLSLSSSSPPCSQSPRKTSFALAKNTHPPLSPTHYHFPLFRRRRRHRLPNEEKEIYILLTRSKGGTDQPLSNFPLAILSFPFPFPPFPLLLAFYSGGTLFRIYGQRAL